MPITILRHLAGVITLAVVLLASPVALALGPEPGETAPELEVKGWTSPTPVKVAEQRDKVLGILFFQTTSPDMVRYIQEYENLLKRYGEKGFKLVGISRESKDVLVNWADEAKVTFPLGSDDGSWKGAYGVEGYPCLYLVDIYGEIAWKGDGNRVESVIPQIELCLREVKRISVKREDTSKNFDKVWRAVDKSDFTGAIKFLEGFLKGNNEDDKVDAEAILNDIKAIADARLKRVEVLEKRLDYLSGEAILKGLEKGFAGIPQSKTAKEILERWGKDQSIKDELFAQRAYEQGRVMEEKRLFKEAAELYRAAMSKPQTRASRKANGRLGELLKRGVVK